MNMFQEFNNNWRIMWAAIRKTQLTIYKGKDSIPEFSGMSDNEASEIWKKCVPKIVNRWAFWSGAVNLALIAVIFGRMGTGIFDSGTTLGYMGVVLFVMVGGGLGGWVGQQIWTEATRPFIREQLAKREQDSESLTTVDD